MELLGLIWWFSLPPVCSEVLCVWSECGEVSGYIMCTFIVSEDAYRIDAEIDGEVVGLDILDTAGQVGEHIFFSFLFLILFILIYFTVFSLLLLHSLKSGYIIMLPA